MIPKKILSAQHPLVRHWTLLRTEKKYREETSLLLLVGAKLLQDCPWPKKRLLSTHPSSLPADETFLVSASLFSKITGLPSTEGIAAEVDLPKPQEVASFPYLLILDSLQDPGNLGSLLRSCAALKWDGVIVTKGTVDLFNDKALRASQGALFHLPFCYKTIEEVARLPGLWIADPRGEPLSSLGPLSPPIRLVLSREGSGARHWAGARKLAIPLSPAIESLNVAAAGAILLHTLRENGEKEYPEGKRC